MKKILLYRFLLTLILSSVFGCTTPYNYQTNDFEDIIVIEATLTNEFKFQEVKLSRTYTLEESEPKFETKAIVYITDDAGNKYDFNEGSTSYISVTQFQASPDRQYQLHVQTKEGKSYLSSTEKLTTQTSIQSVEASVLTKDNDLGVQITVNSSDPTNSSKYYRYEYEETSKIIAPKWLDEQAVAHMNAPGTFPVGFITFEYRTTEARVCFTSQKSKTILLTNTSDLSEDKVTNFPLRFISTKDHFIRNRYSILVKQYVQSLAAHTYFETLQKLSENGSILSQTQPGFFTGNITSVDNPGEKVIGFFDVSSYSEKRLFFNFVDLFPRERLPEYQYYCPGEIPESEASDFFYNYCFSSNPACRGNVIVNLINDRIKVYFPTESPAPAMLLYPIECGDCTSFSSNIKPSFWID